MRLKEREREFVSVQLVVEANKERRHMRGREREREREKVSLEKGEKNVYSNCCFCESEYLGVSMSALRLLYRREGDRGGVY